VCVPALVVVVLGVALASGALLVVALFGAPLYPTERAFGLRLVGIAVKQRTPERQRRKYGQQPAARAAACEGASQGIEHGWVHGDSDQASERTTTGPRSDAVLRNGPESIRFPPAS
jgi:hypothetical protein